MKEIFTKKELMEYLDVSPSTIHNWQSNLDLPFIKVGSIVYFKGTDVLSFLNKHKHIMENANGINI